MFYYLDLYLIVFSLSCVLLCFVWGVCHRPAATPHAHDESIKTCCTKRLFDLIANMNAVVHVQLNKHKDLISLSVFLISTVKHTVSVNYSSLTCRSLPV